MFRHHRAAAILLAAGTLVALAGCSSSGDGKSSKSAPPSSVAAPTTSAAPSTSSEATTAASGDLAAALLRVADLGTGYTEASSEPTSSALPCTPKAAPLFTQAPPQQKVQKSFTNAGSTVQISESVASFDAAAGAQKAFQIGSTGFTCASGTIGDQPVQIVKRAGQPSGGGVDEFGAWDFGTSELKGTAVIVRIDDHIAALTFAASGTAGDKVPVGDIVNKAIAKIAAQN